MAVVVTVVVVITRRRREPKGVSDDVTSVNASNATENAPKHTAKNCETMNEVSKIILNHQGILVENLGSYIECAKKDGKLSTEYAELPTHDSPTEAGDEQANVPKNRFNNIKPFDHSRVVLQSSYNNTGNASK